MTIGELAEVLALHPEVEVLAKELSKKHAKHFLLSGLHASAQAIILSALHRKQEEKGIVQPMMLVLNDSDAAQYMYADMDDTIAEALKLSKEILEA